MTRVASRLALGLSVFLLAAPVAPGCVCTGRTGVDGGGGGGDGGPGGGGDGGSGGKDTGIPGVDSGPGPESDAAVCASTDVTADTASRPVDIIWIIDNSGSMGEEEGYVQTNINSYMTMVGASGLDYHVVMITDTSHISVVPVDPTRFLAVNQNVDSNNPLDLILSTYPMWQTFLRSGSVKHFVAVTDDESDLPAASFISSLGALTAPGFPPTMGEPLGFFFHAIVAEDDPECNMFGIPCSCTDPSCPCMILSAARGDTYITLQTMTGGVFSSLCQTDWTPIFAALATASMANTMLPCTFDIPDAPEGMTLNYDQVNLLYTPSGGTGGYVPRVMSMASCGPMGGWYYDDPGMPTQLIACPATCTVLMNDPSGSVEVAFGCQTVIQ